MKNAAIRELILSLPDDSPFFEEVRRRFFPRQQSLSPADRLVFPLKDPAFCTHFVAAYARGEKFLPDQVVCPFFWRLWSHLLYGEEIKTDPAGCEARALAHPANRAVQGWLKGLLCSGLSYEDVGKWLGLSAKVVEIYSRWHFDFPERRQDHAFVVSVLNPKLEVPLFGSDGRPDPMLSLMRLGYRSGPGAVVRAIQLSDERNGGSKPGHPANIKSVLMSDLEIKARMGLLDLDDPGFRIFNSIAIAEAKQKPQYESEDARSGFGRISADQSCQLVIKQMSQASALEKLKAAQEYDAQQAAAAEAKRKAAENAAVGANDVFQKTM